MGALSLKHLLRVNAMRFLLNRYIFYIILPLLLLFPPVEADAFSTDIYASRSVLASGNWVKVQVKESGMHLITNDVLSAWGFNDPSRVRIYGYPGERIPDQLTRSNYVDDLPLIQSQRIPRGIVFYGRAPLAEIRSGSFYYHEVNPYSSYSYYYITDSDAALRDIPVDGNPEAALPATTFIESVQYENELLSPTSSGHLIVGEDMKFTPTRKFSIQMPGKVNGTPVNMRSDFFAKSSKDLMFTFSINGQALSPLNTDCVKAVTDDWGDVASIGKTFTADGEKVEVTLTASTAGVLSSAYLDRITVCYERELRLPSARRLDFTQSSTYLSLAGSDESVHIWDVTDPMNVIEMNRSVTAGNAVWATGYNGRRRYSAWCDNSTFLTPVVAGKVKNQNIHGGNIPDMVIISHASLFDQASRVADLHSQGPDSLRVLLVTTDQVANEFGSGCHDINAMRRMLKMFYDRGTDSLGHHLQHVLLMGSVNYDHRRVTAAWRNSPQATVPTWQTDNSYQENSSYSTDDPYGILGDNSGVNFSSETMNIGVGRIPAHLPSEAKVFVDRLEKYVKSPDPGVWRNRVMLVADDGNNLIHMEQTESMLNGFMAAGRGRDMTYPKIYVDTYDKVGGVVAVSRSKMHSLLNDGVVWWNYVGHSSMTTNSEEGILDLSDLNNLYLRRAPFYYGATCSFVKWDTDDYSGLEMMALSDAGGIIGGISALRPVYITKNGILTDALGQELFVTEPTGAIRPIGEVLRAAKNRIGSDSNKLRYVLLGDPAMRIAIPSAVATLDSINGSPVLPDDGENDPSVIQALGTTVMSGAVRDASGEVIAGFNGYVDLRLYDAERSFTTKGRNPETGGYYDKGYLYDEQGDQLYAGRARVVDGHWSTSIIIPSEIAENYRNATLSMFAVTDGGDASLSAVGVSRDFYVYGFDEKAVADDTPPVIESMYLNHGSFTDRSVVNSTPMLLAKVSDDKGLNMSVSGIGHQMSLRIDDSINFSDLISYFTPSADGSPSGDIAYQLPELEKGAHTATLKVWDVGGNSSTASIDFVVDPTAAPKLFEVYTDSNPASVDVNFYVSHDRPDAMLTVRIEVYDIAGHPVWSDTSRGRADMFVTSPVNWNLTDVGGHRVTTGVYVYRATVITDATDSIPSSSSSISRKIAVK